MYAVAYILQTDKITDLSYSLTFLAIAITGFFWLSNDTYDVWMLALILIWAIRLGGYLFWRIHKMGRDDRFDHIRTNPISFFGFWIMQGLTCAILSIPVVLFYVQEWTEFLTVQWIGFLIAGLGWLIETIADYQKSRFKRIHPNQFIQSGLWKMLRHPNYTGELMFWMGVFISTVGASQYWIGLVAPLWIAYILIGFSGIPPLEEKWKTKYASDAKFQNYWKSSWRIIPFIY